MNPDRGQLPVPIAARVRFYNRSVWGTKYPASRLWLAEEKGRPVAYGIWLPGNDYRNKSKLYGAYPRGYLERVLTMFPEVHWRTRQPAVLHACSGSLGPGPYVRLDIRRNLSEGVDPDRVGSIYDVGNIFSNREPFELVFVDPPYSKLDAERYGTGPVDRRLAMNAIAGVTMPDGHVVWLDTCRPMSRNADWQTVARIYIDRSQNHRVRVCTILRRRHSGEAA